jgi:hypothetical protein
MQRRIIAKAECDLVADYVRRKGMSITTMDLARAVVDSRSEVIGGSRTRGVRDRLSAARDARTLEGRLKPIQARRGWSHGGNALSLLVAVLLGMSLRGFIGVILGVSGMARRDLRVMGALFDRSRFMMFGGFLVMLSGLFVMLGGLGVVFRNLGCRSGHCSFPSHLAQEQGMI